MGVQFAELLKCISKTKLHQAHCVQCLQTVDCEGPELHGGPEGGGSGPSALREPEGGLGSCEAERTLQERKRRWHFGKAKNIVALYP